MSMENPEHTSGPWKARARCITNDGTQDEMAGLGWNIEGPPEPTRGQFAKAADAYLVAAAPDLLEALKKAEAALTIASSYVNMEQRYMRSSLESIRDAIAKAKS